MWVTAGFPLETDWVFLQKTITKTARNVNETCHGASTMRTFDPVPSTRERLPKFDSAMLRLCNGRKPTFENGRFKPAKHEGAPEGLDNQENAAKGASMSSWSAWFNLKSAAEFVSVDLELRCVSSPDPLL